VHYVANGNERAVCGWKDREPPGPSELGDTRDKSVAPIVPRGLVDQAKIKTGVDRAKRALQPDVVRIMYSFAEDWTGKESLFFRVVISDAAAAAQRARRKRTAY
jgi:hypothetical protein